MRRCMKSEFSLKVSSLIEGSGQLLLKESFWRPGRSGDKPTLQPNTLCVVARPRPRNADPDPPFFTRSSKRPTG
jgi:hypothetical protein